MQIVAEQPARKLLGYLEYRFEVLAPRAVRSQNDDIVREICGFELDGNDLELAGLDLREVEDIIDKAEQESSGTVDLAREFLDLGIAALSQDHLIHTDDGIDGSPDLMRHIREEMRLLDIRLDGGCLLPLSVPQYQYLLHKSGEHQNVKSHQQEGPVDSSSHNNYQDHLYRSEEQECQHASGNDIILMKMSLHDILEYHDEDNCYRYRLERCYRECTCLKARKARQMHRDHIGPINGARAHQHHQNFLLSVLNRIADVKNGRYGHQQDRNVRERSVHVIISEDQLERRRIKYHPQCGQEDADRHLDDIDLTSENSVENAANDRDRRRYPGKQNREVIICPVFRNVAVLYSERVSVICVKEDGVVLFGVISFYQEFFAGVGRSDRNEDPPGLADAAEAHLGVIVIERSAQFIPYIDMAVSGIVIRKIEIIPDIIRKRRIQSRGRALTDVELYGQLNLNLGTVLLYPGPILDLGVIALETEVSVKPDLIYNMVRYKYRRHNNERYLYRHYYTFVFVIHVIYAP